MSLGYVGRNSNVGVGFGITKEVIAPIASYSFGVKGIEYVY